MEFKEEEEQVIWGVGGVLEVEVEFEGELEEEEEEEQVIWRVLEVEVEFKEEEEEERVIWRSRWSSRSKRRKNRLF